MTRGPGSSHPQRLTSLDAFRGLVIVAMFVVNVGGTDPKLGGLWGEWMPHKGWNEGKMGNGLADFVFPWFLFIVGSAIPLSMKSGRGKGLSAGGRAARALKRGVVIYLLGTLVWCASIAYEPRDGGGKWHGPIDWNVLLHWDILPLIGWAYVVGVLVFMLPKWARWAFVGGVLAGKYVLLTQIPHPETGAVVWEAGRSYQHIVNRELGWLGVALTQGLPAAACAVLGGLASERLMGKGRGVNGGLVGVETSDDGRSPAMLRNAWALVVFGIACCGAGYLLHAYAGMPSSKDFFTSSYVLITCGSGTAILGLMAIGMDVKQWTTGWPLRVMGMNALAIYIVSELMWKMVWIRWRVASGTGSGDGHDHAIGALKSQLQGLTEPIGMGAGSALTIGVFVLGYWLMAYGLYRKGWFIRV